MTGHVLKCSTYDSTADRSIGFVPSVAALTEMEICKPVREGPGEIKHRYFFVSAWFRISNLICGTTSIDTSSWFVRPAVESADRELPRVSQGPRSGDMEAADRPARQLVLLWSCGLVSESSFQTTPRSSRHQSSTKRHVCSSLCVRDCKKHRETSGHRVP